MVKQFTFLSLFLISSLALTAQTLVHYWNFNNSTDEAALLAPTLNLVPGAAITHVQGGMSAIQVTSNTAQGFDTANPNAQNGDAALTHLRFNNPIGGTLLFNLPTTGYDNVVVKYATRRSGSGAGEQYVFYTTNGTDFDSLTTILPVDGDPTLQTLDFSGIPAVNDNPNFAIRLTFGQGGGGTAGNNRFDNLTLESVPPPTVDILPTVSFLKTTATFTEGVGDVEVQVAVQGGGLTGALNLTVVAASTAVPGNNYVLGTTTLDLPATDDTLSFLVNLPDNGNLTGGKYLILEIDSSSNAIFGSETEHIMLIADNDVAAPTAQAAPFISLRHVTSVPGSPGGGSAEISAYDPASKRLFVTNIVNNTLDVLNFADPVAPVFLESVDVSSFGGGINSVAVKNGVVAVAIQGDSTAEDGSVVFFDADGTFISAVNVGNLPDMVIFSNDGTKALTANEGEPSSDYSVDPLGSVSVIDLTGGVANVANANVTTLTFESFDGQIDALKAAGVRIFGPNATVGKDLEPEYICVSADDKIALVTLQENNAVATIDLQTLTVTSIEPLGYKNHSQVANILDASDRGGKIFSAAWPIKGAYMPDAIECFEVGGVTYAITANEGDAREWGSFVESQRLGSLSLDSTAFPNADYLQKNELLGRLNVLSYDGDTDGDGDLDEIYSFGGRSFTIWNLATGAAVWDSGDDLEAITAADPTWGQYFNASNGTTPSFKNRSDDKGPEPEAVTIAEIEGRTFAFVGLERIGGIAAYEVTNPAAPEFIQYINTRQVPGGDLGPEGLIFIPKNESPNGRNLLVLSNEISGTLSVFQIELDRTNGGDFTLETYDYTPTSTIADFQGETIFDGGISGLHYIPGTDLEFYAVSDRGPNAVATSHPNATGTTLLFPAPDYAPLITRFKAENGAWTVQEIDPILRPDGSPISGLPLPAGAGSTGEMAWADTTPVVLTPDVWGMDSEGIVEDNFGNLWLCDEYGASVWKINKATKQVIKRYTPFPTETQDAPLPAVVGKRRANRGFEGVAITPNGKVYSMIQSVADNPNTAAGNNGRLLRLVEIDPETDAVRQFAYEINPVVGQIRTRDWKVGDLVAVNNEEFLLVEHAERNGWNTKNIYKINIANATPLTTDDFGGQTMEQVGTAAGIAAFGVNVVEKTLVLDLLEAGWDLSHDKPEGVTIIDDNTIAVVNDNDFGIDSPAGDGTIVFTGKTTRLYIYGLSEPLGYVSPYCTYDYPVASASGCEGDNISLDAGAGFTAYTWSNNATGQTTSVTAEGNYSVTVTNDVGCKAIDSVAVVVYANPVVDLGADTSFCSNEDITLNPGAGFAGYLWSDSSQGQTLTVTTAGTYGVIVEDANGCLGLDEITLTTLAAPVPDLGNVTQTICDGQFINLNAGPGFTTYEWSTGATRQSIQVTTAGAYGVLVSAANGCFGSDVVEVVVNPTPDVNLVSTKRFAKEKQLL
ncbi:MAG: choice-of-anchor I family protein [Saprospiraceae bacterium]|nr:choice-of-anchor I family protein [Saprospiraceae bacterium]